MILDGLLTFTSLAGGGTGAGDSPTAIGNTSSTNQLDLGIIGLPTSASGGGARDIGIGDDPSMKLLVLVTTAFTTGAGGTLQVNFQGAPDNGSGAPGAFVTYDSSPVYAVSALIVGARLFDQDVPRPPPNSPAVPRFLQLQYVIATGVMTAGTLKGFIVVDRHDLPETTNAVLSAYPPGVVINN